MIKILFILLWIGSMFILFSQYQFAYRELPDEIPHKSEMMEKEKFLGIVYGTAVFINALFGGIAFFFRLFSEKLPPRKINIPNKEYWLKTPERLQKATAKMSLNMLWFCLVFNGVFWYIIDLTTRSAEAGTSQPISAGVMTLIFAGLAAGIVYPFLAFRVPGDEVR